MIGPVLIEQVRECAFKARPCALCGEAKSNVVHRDGRCAFKRRNGCDRCGRNKGDRAHYGQPPSYNAVGGGRGTGGAAMVGAQLKQTWQAILLDRLRESDLPSSVERIVVEGEVTFPDRGRRDQGNYRVILEKALGDALVEGGYLPDDDWDHYEFGGLTKRVVPGESATRLTVFPLPAVVPTTDQMELV